MGCTTVNCCLPQCGSHRSGMCIPCVLYHPMDSIAVNCCLFLLPLSFLVERKWSKERRQGGVTPLEPSADARRLSAAIACYEPPHPSLRPHGGAPRGSSHVVRVLGYWSNRFVLYAAELELRFSSYEIIFSLKKIFLFHSPSGLWVHGFYPLYTFFMKTWV